MLLKNVKVQHYKSLDNVSVDLDPGVTVIVGPNGVGKSNFVDALRFVSDKEVDGSIHAIDKRSRARLIPKTTIEPLPIRIACKFADDTSYGLQFELKPNGVSARSHPVIDRAVIAGDRAPETSVESIAQWRYCTIYPNTLRDANYFRLDPCPTLKEGGENWTSILKGLQQTNEGNEALESIYQAIRFVLPTFQDIEITQAGDLLVPQFRFHADESSTSTAEYQVFEPMQLSDGTLRLFGILLAAYQVPRPPLLVIEEPEQTIYPGALALLAEVFKEVSTTTQVIITTHSPHLVEHFAPEQIRVATMQDGITQIRPIHRHQVEAVNEGLLSLREFMAGEGLEPDDTEPVVSA